MIKVIPPVFSLVLTLSEMTITGRAAAAAAAASRRFSATAIFCPQYESIMIFSRHYVQCVFFFFFLTERGNLHGC